MNGGKSTRKYRTKAFVKAACRFLALATIPVIVVAALLVPVTVGQIQDNANTKQQLLATDNTHRVDTYIDTATSQLSYFATLYANDSQNTSHYLETLFATSSDLARVEITTTDSKKHTVLPGNKSIDITTAKTTSTDNILDTLTDKKHILGVKRNAANLPEIAITLPIRDASGTLEGAVTGYYDIADSWQLLLPEQRNVGSAYVVDNTGALVYHPSRNLLTLHPSMSEVGAVRDFLGNAKQTKQTKSEDRKDVISTARTTQVGWGVITAEPVENIYAPAYDYLRLAAAVTAIILAVSTIAALVFSKRTALPIKRLAAGARSLAAGTLKKPVEAKTHDEHQEVADILNEIGRNMNTLVGELETNNRNLALEQSELRSIINNVNDGIIAVNAQGEILSINTAAIKLMPPTEYDVRGKRIGDVLPWTQEGLPLQLDFVTPGYRTYDNVVLAKSEAVTYLDLIVEVIERDRNNVAAIITIHDQTASRELNFMKLDFVAIATHELRTPLTIIMGYLDILNREADKELSPENIESLERAITGARQLRELINKLLNIARIERGDMEIFLDKLNITDMVSQNVREHQSIAGQKEQTLVYTSNASQDIYVPADTTSIAEVLNNLVGNALKYTPRGGQIRVHITTTANDVRVEITDNGPGIPKELQEKLFSKFYRAERSMIAGSRGTGLGLFISKTIIELQNGTIGVSASSGDGSTFYFTLPIYNAERDDELIEQNVARGKHGWFKKRTHH